jgi:Ase1/PRC1/MAP65 family protein
MGPPARAPPPKMRDFFIPPSATPMSRDEFDNTRCGSATSSSGSGRVRHISPEDVYDDRERGAYVSSSVMRSEQNTPQTYRDVQAAAERENSRNQQSQYIATAESRQISATSTSTAAASGSENWETYDDASEPEADASEAYYAKLRATKAAKRYTPEGGYTSPHGGPGKKLKNLYGTGNHGHAVIPDGNGRVVPSGSEAGWTDEDAF